jgi:hypothetical protein
MAENKYTCFSEGATRKVCKFQAKGIAEKKPFSESLLFIFFSPA